MARNTLTIRRLVVRGAALAGMIPLLAIAGGVSMYLVHRSGDDYSQTFGAMDNPGRLDVSLWVNSVDPASQTVSTQIVDVPSAGDLADSAWLFAEDAVLDTSAVGDPIALRRGHPFRDTERRFAVDGTVTDYPFDQYPPMLTFIATRDDNTALPVAVKVWSDDPFFQNSLAESPVIGAEEMAPSTLP